MRFTKMHGLGNDYVYVNCFEQKVQDPARLAQTVSDRHRGIDADGLILICPSEKTDVSMRIFNCDGSEAEAGQWNYDGLWQWSLCSLCSRSAYQPAGASLHRASTWGRPGSELVQRR